MPPAQLLRSMLSSFSFCHTSALQVLVERCLGAALLCRRQLDERCRWRRRRRAWGAGVGRFALILAVVGLLIGYDRGSARCNGCNLFFLALLKPMPRCRFPPIGDEEYLKARATNVREPDSAQHHEAVLSIVRVAGTCYATTLTTAGPKVSVRAGSAILQTPF